MLAAWERDIPQSLCAFPGSLAGVAEEPWLDMLERGIISLLLLCLLRVYMFLVEGYMRLLKHEPSHQAVQ